VIERPSQRWRRQVADQEAAVAAGALSREQAYAIELWPPRFTDAVDATLAAYEREVESLPHDADDVVWAAVERVVLALNAVNAEGFIETDEREELGEYIDQVLVAAGVDVAALTGRRGVSRHELTDGRRHW
jgi:hypothetical protein